MTWAQAQLLGCVVSGLRAARKLAGDSSVIGPDDPQRLRDLVDQGERAKAVLQETTNGEAYIKDAYRRAGVTRIGGNGDGKPG